MKTITAANAVFMLSVIPIFPAPQLLQGYSADAAFDTENAEPAEVVIGVDGLLSAGYVPTLTRQTISLQADSPSADLFEAWLAAQKVAREIYYANAQIILPSIGKQYTMTQGVLSGIVAIPGTRKVLQPRNFVITWGDISPSPFLSVLSLLSIP